MTLEVAKSKLESRYVF